MALILLSGALTACTLQPDITNMPDRDDASTSISFARPSENFMVELDLQTNTVSLPLDQFVLEGDDAQTVDKANVARVNDCVVSRGESEWPRVNTDWDSAPPFPDPYFGLWSPNYASDIGYELPSAKNLREVQEAEDAMSESWWATWSECLDEVGQIPLSVMDSSWPRNVVDQGRYESLENARDDDRWKIARDAWVACLAEFDLEPTDTESMRPTQPTAQSEQQTAMTDVACKEKVGLVPQLVQIVAEYEIEYVNENWEALVALGTEHQHNLERAIAILEALPPRN